MNSQSTAEIMTFAGGTLFIAVWLVVYWWGRKRGDSALRKWAEENGFEVLGREERFLVGTGPFGVWSTGKRSIFHVRLRDQAGQERFCWIRVGSYWGGTWDSDKAEVVWEGA